MHPDGTKKAKARIVLLGFEHPSLTDPKFKTASPVQSTRGRFLLYILATHFQCLLTGLDLATAFLQTALTEADEELWPTGVAELKEACPSCAAQYIWIHYGNPRSVARPSQDPREVWSKSRPWRTLSLAMVLLHREGRRWSLSTPDPDQRDGRTCRLLPREEWLQVCQKVDSAYKWGMIKTENVYLPPRWH